MELCDWIQWVRDGFFLVKSVHVDDEGIEIYFGGAVGR